MNLATLPWERLEIDLERAMAKPVEQRITAADWSALSAPLAAFMQNAAVLSSASSSADGSILQLLADLGLEINPLLHRLRMLLPALRNDPAVLMSILAEGTLDAAAAADKWEWNGIRGVDLDLVTVDTLRPIRLQGQELLRWIALLPEPPTLPEVMARLKHQRGSGLILRWTTQSLALAPGYCPRRRLPTLGRPAMAYALRHRPPPIRPIAQPQPASCVMTATLVDDITSMVLEIALQPVRHRQDWAWRAADAKRILARLAGGMETDDAQVSDRLSLAFDACHLLELTRHVGMETHASDSGLAWLRHSAGERQHQLLERLRRHLVPTPDGTSREDHQVAHLLHRAIGGGRSSSEYVLLWGQLAATWRQLDASVWLRSAALTWWQRHPPRGSRAFEESSWATLVASALDGLAHALGIIAVAGRGESRTIHLTPAGRWAVGLDTAWTPPAVTSLDKPIIVQADHTIIFLAPDAALEVAIGAFTDRLPGAHDTGVLCQLSKSACRRAAMAGLDVGVVVAVLTRASAKPLPANVVRELTGWFGRLRRVTAHPALVITTPDEETATTLVVVVGAVRLGPLAVSLPPSVRLGDLERRLAKENILLDRSTIPRQQ